MHCHRCCVAYMWVTLCRYMWRGGVGRHGGGQMIMTKLPGYKCDCGWRELRNKGETEFKKRFEEMDGKRGLPCIAGSLLSSLLLVSPLRSSPRLCSPLLSSSLLISPLLSSPLLVSPRLVSPLLPPSSPSVMDQMLGWVARPEVLPSPLCVLM